MKLHYIFWINHSYLYDKKMNRYIYTTYQKNEKKY